MISAMETCDSYRPWHDKATHRNLVKPAGGKCLHYYFYFVDAELGLIYLRVPTWAPFRLQFYCNGHSWLARQLSAEGIGYTMADNAFVRIDDWERAQDLADALSPGRLQRILERYAKDAGLEELTPHVCRHTFGKNLVNQGVGIEKVAALLGHANLNTTRLYITPDLRELEDAVEKLN